MKIEVYKEMKILKSFDLQVVLECNRSIIYISASTKSWQQIKNPFDNL